MRRFTQSLQHFARTLVASLIALVIGLTGFAVAPASAANHYVTPDGNDITAIVECLPEQLSEGDLQRAIAEAGNDYLERVFQLKDNYGDYTISQAEKEFQTCLKRQGIVPAAQANQLQR